MPSDKRKCWAGLLVAATLLGGPAVASGVDSVPDGSSIGLTADNLENACEIADASA